MHVALTLNEKMLIDMHELAGTAGAHVDLVLNFALHAGMQLGSSHLNAAVI
jgi:hypothetical protein